MVEGLHKWAFILNCAEPKGCLGAGMINNLNVSPSIHLAHYGGGSGMVGARERREGEGVNATSKGLKGSIMGYRIEQMPLNMLR